MRWFATARLTEHDSRTAWEQVASRDIQRWMAHLLDRYSTAYASNQYRALQQFFKWLAAEDQLPDPIAGLQPPRVTARLVPVFTPEGLTLLASAGGGRAFPGSWELPGTASVPSRRGSGQFGPAKG